jgi:hypothetical protein
MFLKPRAEQRVKFIEQYRSYASTTISAASCAASKSAARAEDGHVYEEVVHRVDPFRRACPGVEVKNMKVVEISKFGLREVLILTERPIRCRSGRF